MECTRRSLLRMLSGSPLAVAATLPAAISSLRWTGTKPPSKLEEWDAANIHGVGGLPAGLTDYCDRRQGFPIPSESASAALVDKGARLTGLVQLNQQPETEE